MELLVKVGSVTDDQKTYQDGDIVCAISSVQIHFCHAEMICHTKNFGFNTVGLRDRGTLLEKYMELTSKYRFTHVHDSEREVERFNLLTEEVDIISDTPNEAGEAMYVNKFIRRRLKNSNHKIFGTARGDEVWYGGNVSRDRPAVDIVWKQIETHSDNLKKHFSQWPFSDREKRGFLPLDCCGHRNGSNVEVSDGTCGERARSVSTSPADPDESPVLIAKKQWQVPYWDIANSLSINVDDIRNKNKILDGRVGQQSNQISHMDDIHVDKVATGVVAV